MRPLNSLPLTSFSRFSKISFIRLKTESSIPNFRKQPTKINP